MNNNNSEIYPNDKKRASRRMFWNIDYLNFAFLFARLFVYFVRRQMPKVVIEQIRELIKQEIKIALICLRIKRMSYGFLCHSWNAHLKMERDVIHNSLNSFWFIANYWSSFCTCLYKYKSDHDLEMKKQQTNTENQKRERNSAHNILPIDSMLSCSCAQAYY